MYTSCAKNEHEYKKEIIKSLYFDQISDRKNQIYEADTENLGWIWSQESFQTWLVSPSCLFWINGKPGSGKSTLMKYIQSWPQIGKHLMADRNSLSWITINFFFDFRADTGIANSLDGFLRSLLLQMVSEMPKQAKEVREFARDSLDPHQKINWGTAALRQAVKKTILGASANICIFVDGLDEYGGSYMDLVELFRDIESDAGKSKTVVKVCFASRPEPIFAESFRDIETIRMQDHNMPSIRKYVSKKFQTILHYQPDTDVLQLRTKIINYAEGVFLWAHLAAEIVIEGIADGESFSTLQEYLVELPSELEAVYDRMLRRLKPRQFQEAYLMLRLISHAARTISLEVLYDAVDLAMGRKEVSYP
ncbi:hypothetical protein GQ53DRAFT_889105, partial [Thozetella sp. PMI_491]